MAIFAVLMDKANAELEAKASGLFPADFYKLNETQWLISANATANALAEQLDIRDGKYGRVIVVQTTGAASGWHGKTAWEWLNQKSTNA